MISAKDLSEDQKASITQWAAEGAQLPDIQKRLQGDLGLNVTYMDTRFLVLDLGVEIQSQEEEEGEAAVVVDEPVEAASPLDPAAPVEPGAVTVTTDEIARPGALVSGRVKFSDGESALWLIDEMGRLGFEPRTPGYQPAEADAIAFENELRRVLDR